MIAQVIRCDQCEKESENPYSEEDWIIINGTMEFTLGPNYAAAQVDHAPRMIHFCSNKCFEAFSERRKMLMRQAEDAWQEWREQRSQRDEDTFNYFKGLL